ncbi:GNAT family N-acetyltransferase [Acidocella sp.]|uniref:GNAT family N-acetyltransferase n=1 Tax=Acidocella sp. TaxID=50710 RepID=UPI0026219B2B|nr:GNAT family protein [Acidocella sp.]
MSAFLPIGPEVDGWPRPPPSRQKFQGGRVVLEPLARRHAAELFAAQGEDDAGFTYLSFGPWRSVAEVEVFIAEHYADPATAFWAVRPLATGRASGFLSLLNIEPRHAAIELGNIWFGPELRRTRAATEAMYLLLRHAADDLGYRRLVWKCNALNEPSRRAAQRLGFTHEGTLRAHMVVKGRSRDTAMFSILAGEWPPRRDAILAWLEETNFDAEGNSVRPLASFRPG